MIRGILSQEDWSILWKLHETRLGHAEHGRNKQVRLGTKASHNFRIGNVVGSTDILEDETKQQAEGKVTNDAHNEGEFVTNEFLHLAVEEEACLGDNAGMFHRSHDRGVG